MVLMEMKNANNNTLDFYLNRIPVVGVFCFIVLYVYAASLYPGGSQADIHSIGFDWKHNYWCNLMNVNGMNGQPNPARTYAIVAMIILCTSLAIFFIRFAEVFVKSTRWKQLVKSCAVISMFCAALMFTKYHDLMTLISSFFGLFVILGIVIGLYRSKLKFYKISGLLCMVLLGLNNYVYYSEYHIEILPLLQKITCVFVLLWVIGLNSSITKKEHEI